MPIGVNSRPPKVVVLTTEPLPLPGGNTSGAGLRAWGLGDGLRSRGLEVVIAGPEIAGTPAIPAQGPFACARTFRRSAIGEFLERECPDVVVLQHWGLAAEIPELSVPLAIDLFGPHLLERLYWGGGSFEKHFSEKLAALRRADFLTCSGEIQRPYFYPIMGLAGFDLRTANLPVVPLSVPPPGWELQAYPQVPLTPSDSREPYSFVYGGAFLAWQDPSKPIDWLLDEMEKAGRGRLYFHCGAHPVLDVSGGRFAEISRRLQGHPHVEMRGFLPFDQSLAEYRKYSVALDLMARNPERELAFTTRTMFHFHAGLPVIYNDYSEISDIIRRHNCGWTLSPDDESGFRDVVRSILRGEVPLDQMRCNARAVAADFAWDKTIDPLAEFCMSPRLREGKTTHLLAFESSRHELERLRGELEACRNQGSLGCRSALRKAIPHLASMLAPMAWLASWPLVWWLRSNLKTAPARQARRSAPDRLKFNG